MKRAILERGAITEREKIIRKKDGDAGLKESIITKNESLLKLRCTKRGRVGHLWRDKWTALTGPLSTP